MCWRSVGGGSRCGSSAAPPKSCPLARLLCERNLISTYFVRSTKIKTLNCKLWTVVTHYKGASRPYTVHTMTVTLVPTPCAMHSTIWRRFRDNFMVFCPAAKNRHITTSPKINAEPRGAKRRVVAPYGVFEFSFSVFVLTSSFS